MKTIYKKLTAIQTTLNAPKNQTNTFGKYKYRSCEDILEALKPLMKEQEVSLIISDEIDFIGDRFYVCAIATLIDNETGDEVKSRAFARESDSKKGMDSAQVTGATSSYARKYALNGLFAIDDNKDPDTQKPPKDEDKKKQNIIPQNNPKNDLITEAQLKKLNTLLSKNGINREAIKEHYNVDSLKNLTKQQGSKLIENLEKKESK